MANKITVTSAGTVVNANVTPDSAMYYSNKSKEWAISDKLIDNEDYSSKYYANESKKQANISTAKATEVIESGNTAVSNIENARDNAITDITNQENLSVDNVNTAGATQIALATEQANIATQQATIATNKTSEVVASGDTALANITTAKDNAITSITNQETTSKTSLIDEGATQIGLIQNEGATQVANVQSTGFYMRDDKLYFINSQGEETEFKSGGSGLEVCDIGMALYVDETKGLRRYLNGQIVDINTNTQAFLNRLLQIQTTNPELFTTESNWQSEALLNIDGCVYKFVLNYADDGETVVSVRLPKYPDYVEINAGGTLPVIGNGKSLGFTTGSKNFGLLETANQAVNNVFANRAAFNVPVGKFTPTAWDGEIDQALGVTTDPTKSGIQTTLNQTKLKMRYFIQIATGSETENNIINDIELNNPYSLFDSKYSDHELNNLSWLKSEGQWNAKAVYPDAYDELLREYNSPDRLATFNKDAFTVVGSPTITDDGVASGFSGSNYIQTITNVTSNTNWQIVVSFLTPSDLPAKVITILHNYLPGTISNRSEIFINGGLLAASVNVDGINIAYTALGSYRVSPNTQYRAKLEFTGSAYNFYYSTGTSNWTRIWTVANSNNVFQQTNELGNDAAKVRAFTGSIDLKQFSITVDGVKVFSGAKSMVKLSTEEYTDYDFVLNTTDETFRLPLKTKLASGKAVVGNGMTLGLTDGTNNVGFYGTTNTSGARIFNKSAFGVPVKASSSIGENPGPNNSIYGVTTDPTKSGIELSDSGLYLYFYVGETVQNANLIDAGRIGEQLANKADKNEVAPLKTSYIVDTYVNGNSWYRVYSDGWCEQGGKGVHKSNNQQVSLLKTMANKNYQAFVQWIASNYNSYFSLVPANLTTTNFTISSYTQVDSKDFEWKACGYIA